jgi:hypothetical protein
MKNRVPRKEWKLQMKEMERLAAIEEVLKKNPDMPYEDKHALRDAQRERKERYKKIRSKRDKRIEQDKARLSQHNASPILVKKPTS